MKVTDIRTMHLAGPDLHGLGGAERTWNILLVRIVDTDAGIYGLGETPCMFGVRESIEHIRQYLIGKSPFDVRPLITTMLCGIMPPGEPIMSPTAPGLGVELNSQVCSQYLVVVKFCFSKHHRKATST